MALGDPNTLFYTPTDDTDLVQTLVELLCGAHPSLPSTTQWLVVDSYDGVTREVPTDNLLSNSGTNWAPGSTISSYPAWIVLQSQPASVAAVHQIYIRMPTSSSIQMTLFPLADFTPGGGTDASPSLPAVKCSTLTVDVTATNEPRSMVWDEGMFALATHNKADASQSYNYLGEVTAINTEADDPRPFVSYDGSTRWEATWERISPIDDTTLLNLVQQFDASGIVTALDLPAMMIPVLLTCTTASHQHGVGWPRHIAHGPELAVNTSHTFGLSLGDRDWCSFRAAGNTTAAMRHDGTTLDSDHLRTRLPYDIEPPTGFPLVRTVPYLARATP